jgi:methyltransferase of FxLD system
MFLELRRTGVAVSGAVAGALLAVPRHHFVPDPPAEAVYRNEVFVTKVVDGVPTSSSSRPATMATMLQHLQVEPGHHVLEIGTGTGYNAALLAHLVGPSGQVTTLDIDRGLIERAQDRLRMGGYAGVRVVGCDGGRGFAAGAPYDRIIATAACWQIPQPWIDQLSEGGIMVVPFRLNGAQVCLTLHKVGEELLCRSAFPCGFIPLAGPSSPVASPAPVMSDFLVASDVSLDGHAQRCVVGLHSAGTTTTLTAVEPVDRVHALFGYTMLQGLTMLHVYTRQAADPKYEFLAFISDGSAVALSTWPWTWPGPGEPVTTYGSRRALELIDAAVGRWHAANRPELSALRGRVYPAVDDPGPLPHPIETRYRFRRGAHGYDLWYE